MLPPTFLDRVSLVVEACSEKEMVRPHALRVVATMKHIETVGDRAIGERIADARGYPAFPVKPDAPSTIVP
jgi:hypothetical protein